MGQENKAIDLTPIGKTELCQYFFLKFLIRPLAVVDLKGACWFDFWDYDFEKKS